MLFVVSDDLRPELPCYGCDHVLAPRTTALAQVDQVHAGVARSLCAPSRSFLSGRRPAHTRAGSSSMISESGPDWTALPGRFEGRLSSRLRQDFHPGLPPNQDLPYSWDKRITTWALEQPKRTCSQNMSWCARSHRALQDS